MSTDERKRVLVLGGGFAGVGAAGRLGKANADVVLVDRHDYHTFQPLLYQLATGLIETTAVGHSLRDLFHEQAERDRPPGAVTGDRSRRARGPVRGARAAQYDYLVLALGAEVNFFGTEGAAEHAFPMYTLAGRRAAEGPRARAVGGGRPRPVARRRRRAQRRRRRRRADRRRDGRRAGRALPGELRQGLPGHPEDKARSSSSRPGRTLFAMFKEDLQEYTQAALEKRASR